AAAHDVEGAGHFEEIARPRGVGEGGRGPAGGDEGVTVVGGADIEAVGRAGAEDELAAAAVIDAALGYEGAGAVEGQQGAAVADAVAAGPVATARAAADVEGPGAEGRGG